MQYLLGLIPTITKNKYTFKDSFEFVSMIDKHVHECFVGRDNRDSNKNVFCRKRKISGLSKSNIRYLLKSTAMSAIFYSNANYYKQLEGRAMGSPLALALTNAFLCHHESKWLRENPVPYAPIFVKVKFMTFLFY